jgi:hypothetical protein
MLRIVAPHFVAGVEPGVVAAPIVSYMRDWSPERVRAYCARRGWQVEAIWPELRGWIGSLPEGPAVPLSALDRGSAY